MGWTFRVAALLAWCGSATAGEVPLTLEEIKSGINRQWDQITSLLVVCDHVAIPQVERGDLKRYLMVSYLLDDLEFFAYKGPKRYYRYSGPKYGLDIAPGVEPDYDVVPGGKEIKRQLDAQTARLGPGLADAPRPEKASLVSNLEVAFDGRRYLRKSGGTVTILDHKNVLDDAGTFQQIYLMCIGRILADPVNEKASRKSERIPDAFGLGGYIVLSDREEVDGASCVVVRSPGRETFWLDPKISYGLRRREQLDPESKLVKNRWTNRDWKEVKPGIWLPQTCLRELCGPPLAPEKYRGKAMIQHVYTVRRLEINDVPDSLFDLPIEPGILVADATRLPRTQDDNQYLLYRMPADANQLNQVAVEALQQHEKNVAERERGRGRTPILIACNVAILAIIGVVVFVRKKRPGGDKAAEQP